MAIIRAARPESNFYTLDKRISEGSNLSWEAVGLLVFLLGKPDHWKVNVEALVNHTKTARKRTGRDGIYGILDELIQARYVQRTRARGSAGRLAGYDYLVSETPFPPCTDLPDTAAPDTAGPYPANPTLVSTDVKQGLNRSKDGSKAGKPPASEKRVSKREQSIAFLVAQGVDPQIAADWMTARKGKEVTLTVWESVVSESAKAGITAEAAVAYAAASSWQGFKADWYRRGEGQQAKPTRRDDQRAGSMAAMFPRGMPGQAGYGEAARGQHDGNVIDGEARWIDGGG
ncbi:hypothetical protein [Burkholderia sp. USMB20]|uniref:hypothetical protein n=1 Tax=Burkholderia sp. USMB20 TaxID=1571773 RepID=UPI000ADB7F87|nr:hypothetical protein [Burkholderia sp. USMB20]TGN96106.1 hypothetical protein PL79_018855 [Burkholderia sp. USMB20]